MPFPWLLAASVLWIVGDFIYHRLSESDDPRSEKVDVPKTEEGTEIGLLFGRYRIRKPVLAYAYIADAVNGTDVGIGMPTGKTYVYGGNFLFVLCIPVEGGTSRLHKIWSADKVSRANTGVGGFSSVLTLEQMDGGSQKANLAAGIAACVEFAHGPELGRNIVEFLDGRSTQKIADETPPTYTGETITGAVLNRQGFPESQSPKIRPGYRGYLTAFFCGAVDGFAYWCIGPDPQISSYTFECTSLPADPLKSSPRLISDGDGMNPVDVIRHILIDKMGKCGVDTSYIDTATFTAAAETLDAENHPFSMFFDARTDVDEMINAVLKQIDGILFEDPFVGKIKLKLVRDDYDVSALTRFNDSNIINFVGPQSQGLVGPITNLRLKYPNREEDYESDSVTAFNQVSAAYERREEILDFPGITTKALADQVCARELSARSRPLIKCSITVGNEYAYILPGDTIDVSHTEAGITGLQFRVGQVTRGKLEDGAVKLDLIQEYFYTYRNVTAHPPALPHFPGHDAGGAF